MKIPLPYIARNLWARRLTTALTAGGLALVVFVFATVLMLDEGLRNTLVTTGEYDNVVVTRRSAETEVQSGVDRNMSNIVASHPAIARDAQGRPLLSKETVVLISLPRRGSGKASNVVIRGASQQGFALRPQVHVTEGRLFTPGASEVIVGSGIARRFAGVAIGDQLRFGQREWTVVGLFDAGNSGFDSEIWGDADQLVQAFRRLAWSSIVLRLSDSSRFEQLKGDLENDPRLTVEARREQTFYADQSKALSNFISILGLALSIIFSVGAMIGATITMYASVASRTAEIGTLRALGYQRRHILAAFLLEAMLLALVGGVAGLACASLMQMLSFSTTNFQSFSELAFGFRLTPLIAVKTLMFAMAMGFIGGFLPAVRAARMKIVDALRAA
ncbi:ABC transporter permease [Pseudoduganella ginsengisoli]|uniref:FtsX-like permease family protein n=1 Tax=Pseudoduganella ginsengisoli TaxID=1462440 RepID=A0A6L6PY77_9BURK|nr:ABC transporter permease [Pseudoduganella ginsengisoli]MTW02129.1 FtsX-like permease family protein [Pseudoduganella ginsengisoli]